MGSRRQPPAAPARVVVALAGAAGVEYGLGVLAELRTRGLEAHLVTSARSARALAQLSADAAALATRVYDEQNQAAAIASGSFRASGMIVAPCDERALTAIVLGLATTLVYRAADVALKEARPLVLGVAPGELGEPSGKLLQRARAIPRLCLTTLDGPVAEAAARLVDRVTPRS